MTNAASPMYMTSLQANGFTVVESIDGNGELQVSINGQPPMTPQAAVVYGFQQLQALGVPGSNS